MAKHTPGPWQTWFEEYGGYDCMTDAWMIRASSGFITKIDLGDYSQKLNDRPYSSPEAEANARLIAAAPDLLKVANGLIWLYNNSHNYGSKEFLEFFHAAVSDARIAIAKVEGTA